MGAELLSIIVVTRRIRAYLRSCLDSIRSNNCPGIEIIVVDNSLEPDYGREIGRQYPEIKFYSSVGGLSYCESLNKGIGMGRGDFILCLNDDVILDKDFIGKSIRGFSSGDKIGMVSGKILRQDRITIDSTGLFLSLWRTPKERGYGTKDRGRFEREGYIFGVTGAVAFYRREMLEDIKSGRDYFDTDYRFFYEDLDIAWRAQKSGWKGYYVPQAVAYHVRGGTARSGSGIGKPYARRYINAELELDLLKNRYLTIIKNERILSLLLHLPFILAYDILVWAYVLCFKPALVKKFTLNLKYLRAALNKRKLILRAGIK